MAIVGTFKQVTLPNGNSYQISALGNSGYFATLPTLSANATLATQEWTNTTLGSYLLRDGSNSITGQILPSSDYSIDFGGASKRFHYGYFGRLLAVQTIGNSTDVSTNQITLPSKSGTMALTSDIPGPLTTTAKSSVERWPGGSYSDDVWHYVTPNDIYYWNGAVTGTTSYLAYCNQGAFGSVVTHSYSEFITTSNIGSQSVSYAASAGSAPASDVYVWAKASTKPSYNFGEIGAGTAVVDYNGGIVFRSEDTAWYSGIYYSTPNEEAVVFANKSQGNQDAAYQQQWLFAYTDMRNRTGWTSLGSNVAMQIKGHRVAINKMVGSSTQIPYNLDVNGTANATSYTVNTKATMQYNTMDECIEFVFA